MQIGVSIYLLAGHLAYRAINNAQWEPWEVLRKALGDLNLQHHSTCRKYTLAMVCGGFLFLRDFRVCLRTDKVGDSREFPSLSGASQQSQSQTPGQLMWANASQRAAQQTPVQRQQHPPTSQPPSRSSQPHGLPTPQQSQQQHDDMFPSGAQFANRLDDFRNGGQGISSQLGAGGQPQPGNIEEFPPLGRNAAAGSLMQGAGFGSYGSGMGTSRSPISQVPNGILGQDKEVSIDSRFHLIRRR